jgi:hypothetical protein
MDVCGPRCKKILTIEYCEAGKGEFKNATEVY